jgi:hypothetical protein
LIAVAILFSTASLLSPSVTEKFISLDFPPVAIVMVLVPACTKLAAVLSRVVPVFTWAAAT